MKIFEEDGKVRLQLKNLIENTILFDFTVKKENYPELSDHIIEHLLAFKVSK
jgi:hypothetical protein